jgi:hypothetical protein
MAFVEQPAWVKQITDAMGLGKVRRLNICLEVNAIPVVDVEFFPSSDQIEAVGEIFETKRFRITEIKSDEEARG